MQERKQEDRKRDHIDLAMSAQTTSLSADTRFDYEPLFHPHPDRKIKSSDKSLSQSFLGKELSAPLWVSSMTGGVGEARHINQNLARVCAEFGLGMGLGSCRVLLDSELKKKYFDDFNLRPIMGPDLPLFANLGIAQIEELLEINEEEKINDLVNELHADGLIIHINPLQEWLQPEGDQIKKAPLETLTKLTAFFKKKIIVKEVGQGMGPRSLKALLDLPIDAIELAAFGGTNFSKLEFMRLNKNQYASWMDSLIQVGHTAPQMIDSLNALLLSNPQYKQKEIIISGGVKTILDAFWMREKLGFNSVIGQAKNFLVHAENYDDLAQFVESEFLGLKVAKAFLIPKFEEHK